MRYAILSDIHANRQALKAVLTDIRATGADSIITLGDLVGYGPNPAEVLETVYGRIHNFVLGNHDAVVSGQLSGEYFNDRAKQIIDWTRQELDRRAIEFFRAQPLMLQGENCRFVHGDFADPGRFDYIIEPEEALASFKATSEPLMFAGHSHIPGIYVIGQSGFPHWLNPQDFALEEGKRYIVNVGSVGQPRDDDIRASYCIYDDSTKSLFFRKVPFDIDAYREDVNKAGIPPAASYFLAIDDGHKADALRDIIDFHAVAEKDAVHTSSDIRDLENEVKRLRSLKIVVIMLILLIGALGVVVFRLASPDNPDPGSGDTTAAQTARTGITIPAREAGSITGTALPLDSSFAGIPGIIGEISAESPLDAWSIYLEKQETQRVSVIETEDSKSEIIPTFQLESGKPAEIILEHRTVTAQVGQRYTFSAFFKNDSLKEGFSELRIEQLLSDGSRRILKSASPKQFLARENWIRSSCTVSASSPIEKDNTLIFSVYGKFGGRMLLRKISITRSE